MVENAALVMAQSRRKENNIFSYYFFLCHVFSTSGLIPIAKIFYFLCYLLFFSTDLIKIVIFFSKRLIKSCKTSLKSIFHCKILWSFPFNCIWPYFAILFSFSFSWDFSLTILAIFATFSFIYGSLASFSGNKPVYFNHFDPLVSFSLTFHPSDHYRVMDDAIFFLSTSWNQAESFSTSFLMRFPHFTALFLFCTRL